MNKLQYNEDRLLTPVLPRRCASVIPVGMDGGSPDLDEDIERERSDARELSLYIIR